MKQTQFFLNRLEEVYNSARSYVETHGQSAGGETKARVSQFWTNMFNGRQNFPSLNEIQTFRRFDYKQGIGDRVYESEEHESARHLADVQAMEQFVPLDYIRSLKEPLFGAPNIYSNKGVTGSVSYVMNSGTSWVVKENVERYLKKKSGINVAEIGPGWGGVASQILQKFDINSYTICDLPQNLFLSSICLQTNFEDFVPHYVTGEQDVTEIADKHLYISLPQHFDRVKNKFDLIINSFSLQEMNRETVTSYIDWIYDRLDDEGIFVSLNGSKGVENGPQRCSHYGFQNFCIHRIRPFWKTPSDFFNGITAETVLSKPGANFEPYDTVLLDALGGLIQLGLNDDITHLLDRFADRTLDEDEKRFLYEVHDFFFKGTLEEKSETLARLRNFSHSQGIVQLMAGYRSLLQGNLMDCVNEFIAAYSLGIKNFAKVKALVFLGVLLRIGGRPEEIESLLPDIQETSPSLYERILVILQEGTLEALCKHALRHLPQDHLVAPTFAPQAGRSVQ